MRGTETWTQKLINNMLRSSEIRYLRSVAGYKRLNKKRNTDIKEELEVSNLNEGVAEQRNKWKTRRGKMQANKIPRESTGRIQIQRKDKTRPFEGTMEKSVKEET